MMDRQEEFRANARLCTIRAARWLSLIRYQVRSAAPMFSAGISTYDDMLDPTSTDDRRLRACIAMRAALLRSVRLEELIAEGQWDHDIRRDPHGQEWRITPRGAVLEAIADLLDLAIADYVAAEDSSKRS
ncbi:hypothetical protein ACR03S_03840 [Limimaricola variabilis]